MSIEVLLYFINLIGNVNDVSSIFFAVSIIFLIVSLLFSIGNEAFNKNNTSTYGIQEYETIRKLIFTILNITAPVLIISLIILILSPSKTTMYAMALSKYSKQSDIPEKVLKAIEFKLDEVVKGVCEK